MAATLTDTIRIAVAQLDSVVGDIDGNLAKARAARAEAARGGADLLVLSELFIAGYPPEDLVLKPAFQDACRHGGRGVRQGHRRRRAGRRRRHAVAGGRQGLQRRRAPRRRQRRRRSATRSSCPTTASSTSCASSPTGRCPVRSASAASGSACRSARTSGSSRCRECLPETGAEMLIVPNGSPYWQGKADDRACRSRSRASSRPACRSSTSTSAAARTSWSSTAAPSALHGDRSLAFQMPQFEERIAVFTWSEDGGGAGAASTGRSRCCPTSRRRTGAPASWGFATTSTRTAFPGVVLGLSGGIDSAVVRGDGGRCARAPSASTASCCPIATPRMRA